MTSLFKQHGLPLLAAGAILSSPLMAHSALAEDAPQLPVAQATVTVQGDGKGKKISPDLVGIFFEDLSNAADGGLYAELIQNRSFDYSNDDHNGWNALTCWDLVERGGGKGKVTTESAISIHANNPQYAVLTVDAGGTGVGLRNSGFDGIALQAGERYNFSCFARRAGAQPMPLVVTLESKDGTVLATASFEAAGRDWTKFEATLQPNATDLDARLVVQTTAVGAVALDMVSLFPEKTFHNRRNGLRADLAQTIADLKPKFMRFPGGCLAHGDGINNIYNWKNTIGPVERRKGQPNIWRYHQSVGLGYFEYFQFCEDIGAKPLPVVAAGVSCQNSFHQRGTGQQGIPLANMDEYIQDVLDLVEYANGPATSYWGAKRAEAGHPKPFNLQYLGVGNEDAITPEFHQRFEMIYRAVKAKYPQITVVGTVGPAPSGGDFEEGWKIADTLNVDMVDEHYYSSPEWFLNNLNRYDSYDRKKSKVYLGEYASRGNTFFNALSEAAYLTSLERNGDVVHMASYAPLLANSHHINWAPNLIFFDNTRVAPTVNYYVQQLYGTHSGDTYLPSTVSFAPTAEAPKAAAPVSVFVGTWNTQAEFENVRLQSGAKPSPSTAPGSTDLGWNGKKGAWAATNGSYAQSGNEEPALYQVASAQVVGTDGQPAYTYSLRARKTAGQEGFLIGFGATDASDYYWWNLGGWGNTKHGIEWHRDGAAGLVGQTVSGSIETGRWYDIKIEVSGSHIRCFLDGKLIHDVVADSNTASQTLLASSVRDSKSGDLILKLVNMAPFAVQSKIDLSAFDTLQPVATKTVLTGDLKAVNSFEDPRHIVPQTSTVRVGKSFDYAAPPQSFTVIRIKTRA